MIENKENGKIYIKRLKLRPGRPAPAAGPDRQKFGPRKKFRFFDLVTPGRSGNPMALAGRVLAAGDGDGPWLSII